MRTQQMTLQGGVCRYMGMKVGLSKEFEAELPDWVDKYTGRIFYHGCAVRGKGVGYVFVDNIADTDYLYSLCPHLPLIETCIEEISLVSVHELLHLCGCTEEEIEWIQRKLFPHYLTSVQN